jgi:hypothetical protein
VVNSCAECLSKQREIDRFAAEVARLKQALHYQESKTTEGFFGSSTSSAKKPAKANTVAPKVAKKRGARVGHPGHGRKPADPAQADRVVPVPSAFEGKCPRCGKDLERKAR